MPLHSIPARPVALHFSVHVWFRRAYRGPVPLREAIKILLAELDGRLMLAGARPVRLVCEATPPGTFAGEHAGDHLARVSIEAEPGDLKRPLVSWYEWQHPRWNWAAPAGSVDGAAVALIGGAS